MRSGKPIIFSTGSYTYLKESMEASNRFDTGVVETRAFPDNELYRRLLTPVDRRDVVLVGGTISDSDTLELYDLACAIAKYGAASLTLVIPYFGYSTMERAVKPGEVVTAKTRARLLSAIPQAMHGNRIFLLDLHSEGLPHYFEGQTITRHIYAKQAITQAIANLLQKDFTLASTDAGRAKWVQSLANDMGVPASFVLKRRTEGNKTELAAISAHVQGRTVIIYDDMIRTGSSLITAARAYKEAGAGPIFAVATHGVFPGEALAEIERTALFQAIICTNTHPRARYLAGGFLSIVGIEDILVNSLTVGMDP